MTKVPDGQVYVMNGGVLKKTDITGEQINTILEGRRQMDEAVTQERIIAMERIDKLNFAVALEKAEVARLKGYMKQMKITLEALI